MTYKQKYIKYKNKYLYLKNQVGGNFIINIISDNTRFNIIKKSLNNTYIYIINDNERKSSCAYEITTNIICLVEDIDIFYLMKINIDTGEIVYLIDDELLFIKCQIEDKIIDFYSKNKGLLVYNLKKNFKDIFIINYFIEDTLDISNVKAPLEHLNSLLKIKCPNLEIEFDYMYNLKNVIPSLSNSPNYNDLTLCLYYNDGETENCNSSIKCIKEKDGIELVSKTNLDFINKKYNKLLRAVIIIISKFITIKNHSTGIITQINKIYSDAHNPISAWLFINSFNAQPDSNKFSKFINERPLTFELFEEYIYGKKPTLKTYIEINEINIDKAKEIFDSLLSNSDTDIGLKCY
jgi:hypothetical protein